MANSVWQGTVQDAAGNIVTGAEISVYDEGTGTLATIFSDIGGTALTNPFFSDANGFAQFYASAGQYRITAVESGSGLNQTFRHVRLGEAGSVDTGVASGEVPLNSDLPDFGTAAEANTGTATGNLPTSDQLSMVGGNTNFTSGNFIIPSASAWTPTVSPLPNGSSVTTPAGGSYAYSFTVTNLSGAVIASFDGYSAGGQTIYTNGTGAQVFTQGFFWNVKP